MKLKRIEIKKESRYFDSLFLSDYNFLIAFQNQMHVEEFRRDC
jgi:hypothetical protein